MNVIIFTHKNVILVACYIVLCCSCMHSKKHISERVVKTHKDLKSVVFQNKHNPDVFLNKGPFTFKVYEDFSMSLDPLKSIETDLYLSANPRAGLVIFIHGNTYNRKAHKKQAEHLASWGLNGLVVDLPNRNHWIENGKSVARLVRLIKSFPGIVKMQKSHSKIYLVGHSFGGSAAVLAAGTNVNISGAVLLDPAVVHDKVEHSMKLTKVPVIILGADKKIFKSRRRPKFFRNLSGPVTEVSVVGATHTDAQLPSIHQVKWGIDFVTHEKQQKIFLSNLVSSLLSLHLTGGIELAWKHFKSYQKLGLLKNIKIKR